MRGGRYPLGFPPRKPQPIAKAAGGGVWPRDTSISRGGFGLLLACLLAINNHVSGSACRGHQGFPRVMDQEEEIARDPQSLSSHTTACHVLERERAS